MNSDLKPENVLSATNDDGDEKIKIADFGFSKAFDESTLRTSCGSPNYVGAWLGHIYPRPISGSA
jgi:serine/threonine protein kinase